MIKVALIMSFVFIGCVAQKQSETQGIEGQVRWIEGNLMPSIGDTTYNARAKGKAVQRQVFVYEATKMGSGHTGVFFEDIESRLVKQLKTDKQGKFKIALPSGKYSLFVKEDEGLFASTFDGEGFINPVQVREGEFSEITIVVNYKAYY